jgi:hypothetical protein
MMLADIQENTVCPALIRTAVACGRGFYSLNRRSNRVCFIFSRKVLDGQRLPAAKLTSRSLPPIRLRQFGRLGKAARLPSKNWLRIRRRKSFRYLSLIADRQNFSACGTLIAK